MTDENLQILGKQDAWVVFSNTTDLPWLKSLRKGFRHCSLVINDGTHWVTYDPLSNYTDIVVHHMPADFDLPRWLKARGHIVVRANIDRPSRPAPWMVMSCVESVKRVLGIHAPLVITPWQFYRYLNRADRACDPGVMASVRMALRGWMGKIMSGISRGKSMKGNIIWEA